MTIIVDTREQLPLWEKKIIRRALMVGDYSTTKLEGKFHIERKSPQDLYGSIIQNHVRFRKMFVRAKVNNIKVVVFVESTRKFFIDKKFPQGHLRKCASETLDKILTTMCERHKIEIIWCRSRSGMIRQIKRRLELEEIKHHKRLKAMQP
jgi:ERCC4-type nuclease